MSETATLSKFKDFIQSNRESIYSTTPRQNTISQDDPWFKDDKWDEIYKQTVLTKENK